VRFFDNRVFHLFMFLWVKGHDDCSVVPMDKRNMEVCFNLYLQVGSWAGSTIWLNASTAVYSSIYLLIIHCRLFHDCCLYCTLQIEMHVGPCCSSAYVPGTFSRTKHSYRGVRCSHERNTVTEVFDNLCRTYTLLVYHGVCCT